MENNRSNTSTRNEFIQSLQKYNNVQNPNEQNKTNLTRYKVNKRNIKNSISPICNTKKYRGNNIKKKIAAVLISMAMLGGGIKAGTDIYRNHINDMNKEYSRNLQSEIKITSIENLKQNIDNLNLPINGKNFNISLECNRPELYKVLTDTDLDELLNNYLINPTDIEKDNLCSKLIGREKELAQFNIDLIEASLADGENTSRNNISMRALFRHYNDSNGERIMNGQDLYMGNTLTINTSKHNISGISGETYDFKQIPSDLFKLISSAKFQLHAPNSSYFEGNNNSKIERAIETYKKIKLLINDKNFKIENDQLILTEIEPFKPKINNIQNDVGREF